MRSFLSLADDALLEQIGQRLAGVRLAKNLTQKQVADQAGLGLRTVQRLEQGVAASQLSSFLRICRVLDLLENLHLLIPEQTPSPLDQLKLEGKKRQRSSGEILQSQDETKPWTWDDPS